MSQNNFEFSTTVFKSSYTLLILNLLSLDLINLEIGIMNYHVTHVTMWSSPCRINYRWHRIRRYHQKIPIVKIKPIFKQKIQNFQEKFFEKKFSQSDFVSQFERIIILRVIKCYFMQYSRVCHFLGESHVILSYSLYRQVIFIVKILKWIIFF